MVFKVLHELTLAYLSISSSTTPPLDLSTLTSCMFLKHAKLTLEAFSCGFYFPSGRKCLINEHRYLVYLLLFSLYVNKLTF